MFLASRIGLLSSPLLCLLACNLGEAEPKVYALFLGDIPIHAELVEDPAGMRKGLMHRKTLPIFSAMLFKFPAATVRCFWMKNTFIPLAAIFLADTGEVINIEYMQPLSLKQHCSTAPALYAIEVNQDLVKQSKLKAGMRVAGLPRSS